MDGDLRETLLSAVGALAAEKPLCLRSVPAAATPPPAQQAPPRKDPGPPHDHGHHHHGKGDEG